MADSSGTEKEETKKKEGMPRRQFLTGLGAGIVAGAVVGAGIGALGFPQTITKTITQSQTETETTTQTQTSSATSSNVPTSWDLTADVVVIGAGAAGHCAALAAFNSGASVIIVDQNYDVGGHAIVSGGFVDLGAGNAAQIKAGINDSVNMVFQDLTLPASYNPGTGPVWAQYQGPWQDREMSWVFAQNNIAAFNFLVANGIQFSDMTPGVNPTTSHWNGASHTPRTNSPLWNGSTSNPPSTASPVGNGGVGFIRPLEATARSKGIQYLLNYKMTSAFREPNAGSVVGISANYTGGRTLPGSRTLLQSYATQGNVNTTQATVNVKANKGVILATGGDSSNVDRRRRYDPRMWDVYQVGGEPYSFQTGDGEIAAEAIGASVWATANETSEYGSTAQITKPGWIGCQYGYGSIHFVPASPIFPLARAGGLSVSNYQDVIEVNMAGVRFADETQSGYPTWIDPAMCINSASQAPDWSAGPIWAIFDSAAVTREGWTLGSPNTDPLFFFEGNDIPTLVNAINTNQYQTSPMSATALESAISRYNSFVTSGVDSDFGKPTPKYMINTPPYYAAFATPTIHDTLTGLRTDYAGHVIDVSDNVIPGLFCAGESAGGMCMHGLAKCVVFGVLAGQNAATGGTSSTIASALSPPPTLTLTTSS
jgi:hypothetical protein